jgi:signal transduction histidine kinase/HAMP domain-containing protein
LGPWLALAALSVWTAIPSGAFLLLAAAGVTAAFLTRPRDRSRTWGVGVTLLIGAILAGFGAHRQVSTIAADWDGYWAARESKVGRVLTEELESTWQAGESAADALVAAVGDTTRGVDVRLLRKLRGRDGISALALYDGRGELVVWDGMHRGRVPDAARLGEERYLVRDLPLFGYLYVTATAADGSVAVAAQLLRTDLPAALGAQLGDFATDFGRKTGEEILVSADSLPGLSGVWDVDRDGVRLVSVAVVRPDRDDRVEAVLVRWRRGVAIALLLGWLLLAAAAPPRRARALVAAVALATLALTLPIGTLVPVPAPLGRTLLVLLSGVVMVSVLPEPRFRLRPWMAGALGAVAFPALLAGAHAALAGTGFEAVRIEWVVYATSVSLALALVSGTLLFSVVGRAAPRGALWVGLALAGLCAGGGASFIWSVGSQPVWWPALWGVPLWLVAGELAAWEGWQRRLTGWFAATVIAGTAAAPAAWSHRVEARVVAGTERLVDLASDEDPRAERDLYRLGSIADSLQTMGKGDVDILYGAWRGSGLAALGLPLRLTLWTPDGRQGEELRIGVGSDRLRSVTAMLEEARAAGGLRLTRAHRDDARYVLAAPLSNGAVVTVVVPPFSTELRSSPLGSLVTGRDAEEATSLTLIPLLPGDPRGSEGLSWRRTRAGWQGDVALEYDNATYHAHYVVDLPSPLLAFARGTLLPALGALLFFFFWLVGRALLGELAPARLFRPGFGLSFRVRVTLALFGFFVLANALFGTLAYRTLSQAGQRSARAIAERVVEDAAGWYLSLGGQMESLARQVGAELLEYRKGQLREGSVGELVELGLYEGWIPFEEHRLLDGREGIREVRESGLGRWKYVTAYRRLPDGDVLAAQVPLRAGSSAIRTADLIELLGFALLIGAALSLALAWPAGRALTSPIRQLLAASEGVGAGNLSLRLPDERGDEFGAVFRAFNRMVGRVRRARRQLVRTSRRTQTIMDEAAVGMVALDTDGNVTVANPSAEELLGAEVRAGHPIVGEGPVGVALSDWLADFLAGSSQEADAELHAAGRRLRVRARRLESFGARQGAVVAMDDVTDELRTERVLAWGEMARQVAHEVKNPLTPIKLSIQHIRRAWDDDRADFDEILVRNADAMLAEIDRLAAIAQSFSRFGAPGGESVDPLTEVSVPEVIEDIMALYGASTAPARFKHAVPPDLPTVVARIPELKEVLINLLENARAAVGNGGSVKIRAYLDEPRGTVVIEVSDDGSGIPAEHLDRVFEPRFSTRSTGTGLGLAIVQRLVRGWGASVDVESEVGEGTTVSLRLRRWVAGQEADPGGDPAIPAD